MKEGSIFLRIRRNQQFTSNWAISYKHVQARNRNPQKWHWGKSQNHSR